MITRDHVWHFSGRLFDPRERLLALKLAAMLLGLRAEQPGLFHQVRDAIAEEVDDQELTEGTNERPGGMDGLDTKLAKEFANGTISAHVIRAAGKEAILSVKNTRNLMDPVFVDSRLPMAPSSCCPVRAPRETYRAS
jgi:hypothetical protein